MKKRSIKKKDVPDGPTVLARWEFVHPTAASVCIAGTFNGWHPDATPMVPLGNGLWWKELTLPPGRYEYRFVVDGAWLTDPAGAESTPNPFGELNSVRVVALAS